MFSVSQINHIKERFTERFENLERDSYRAFTPNIKTEHSFGLGVAPFPITLFCMSTLDYFSGLYVGYSRKNNIKERLQQAERMAKFSEIFLHYKYVTSLQIIKVFRHILVHTAEPSITEKLYKSGIKGWILSEWADGNDHWTIKSYVSENKAIHFAVGNFVSDLKKGVLGKRGYFNILSSDKSLQDNYKNFYKELNSS